MKTVSIFLLSALALSFVLFNQEEELVFKKGLPSDLKTTKVVFLRYDSTKVDAKNKKAEYYQKRHNKNVPDANKEWAEAAKGYPYSYIIASRKDLASLKEKGYKYFLDCPALKNMESGTRNDDKKGNTITYYEYRLYFQEIGTTNAWIISDEFNENQLYFPKFIMNKYVIKAVKKGDK